MLSFNLKLCLDFTFLLRYHSLCKFDLLFKALMRISYQSTKQIETFFFDSGREQSKRNDVFPHVLPLIAHSD